ncbi:hypothetical protein IFO69_18010 [Echinicola sp. CAU 1574]|uniref:Uncharacterized protein n=1 Tax=Echinicola arenosa TaxID=2774144 RepID=A0ABR9ASR4_9BACT|nr:hypothetical protein [Echinicola arenosa]MBD8490654.1 hypothetical protein [Echinicola arenosa]
MRTIDFIQLLELTPKMPILVEHLPGLFIPKGFSITQITQEDSNAGHTKIQIHLSDEKLGMNSISTDEFHTYLMDFLTEIPDFRSSQITVVYGNQEFRETELDVTEIEVYQRTFTIKLFSTNNLKKAKERRENASHKDFEPKRKKNFTAIFNGFTFPVTLGLNWNISWLQISK